MGRKNWTQEKQKNADWKWAQKNELVSLKDGKLILNTWRGFSHVNVWLTVSDSSSIFHQILPTTFNSIHLLGVTASKSVLLLHNTAPYVDGEVLSTIQFHLATPAVHLRTLRCAIFRACAIHGFCFFPDFVNARLCSESRVNVCVNVFFFTLIIMLSLQNTDDLIIITFQS